MPIIEDGGKINQPPPVETTTKTGLEIAKDFERSTRNPKTSRARRQQALNQLTAEKLKAEGATIDDSKIGFRFPHIDGPTLIGTGLSVGAIVLFAFAAYELGACDAPREAKPEPKFPPPGGSTLYDAKGPQVLSSASVTITSTGH